MPSKRTSNRENSVSNLSKEIVILFILFNFAIWAIIGYMYLVAYLQKNYIDVAKEGLNFAISIPLTAIGMGLLSKVHIKIGIIKLYNFAIFIATIHLFMDILHFPNLNWLNRTKN